ncbi:photosynthetic reaction center cytochrome PufC [Acidisoma sp. 7E03]
MTNILLAPFRFTASLIVGAVASARAHPYKTGGWVTGIVVAAIAWGLASTLQTLPMASVQLGYRGTGMIEQYNVAASEAAAPLNTPPATFPSVTAAGKPASAVYKNVQILKTVDANDFLRVMAGMTQWVAPQVGCAYCHSVANMASDAVYTKEIARHMLLMTQYINENWKSHVGAAGVTCGTCHRGQGAPQFTWTMQPPPGGLHGYAATTTGENYPSAAADLSALPSDPYTPFLLNAAPISVQGATALPDGNRTSIEQTNWTYALMMHFAHSLGVGCNYCHNSRAFSVWDQGTPNRVTAWYGIQMVRDLNANFMVPITKLLPRVRLGALGDVPKINCETCHQGAYAPYYGAHVVDGYPALTHSTGGSAGTAETGTPPPFVLPTAAKSAAAGPAAGPAEASLAAPVSSGAVAQSGGATP